MRGLRIIAWLRSVALVAFVGTALAQGRGKNTTTIPLGGSQAELEWLSTSTFRVQRCFRAVCASRPEPLDRVDFKRTDHPDHIEFRTEYLTVDWDRKTATATVKKTRDGAVLFRESAAPHGFAWTLNAEEQIYGLGHRDSAELNLRGQTVATTRPFLISTVGYGLFFGVPGPYHFDLNTAAKVTGPFAERVEYFFYYGPTPKEVVTEHEIVTGTIQPIAPRYVDGSGRVPPYAFELEATSMAHLVRQLAHASLSAMLVPLVDVDKLPGPLAAFWPVIKGKAPAERPRWTPYLYTYLKEAHDRGLPMVRPLAMQYPDDATARGQIGTFMIGDELLFSLEAKTYLPRGIWTNFCTDQVFRGRQTIDSAALGCPMVHNGTIVPMARPDKVMELHYYPRLGAEFFLAEADQPMPTQVHAGPAGEYLRLEAEPLVDHEFEWVVHHVSAPEKIEPATPFTYDAAKKSLRVRIKAPANSDIILNISLKEPL